MRQLSTLLYLTVVAALVLIGAASAGADGPDARAVPLTDQQALAR